SLTRETDFRREARSIVLFRSALTDVPDLWIPNVVTEYSSRIVLTLEFSDGERVDLYAKQHPELIPRAITTLVRLMLQTIFEEGLFHADPHPGNLFVLPDGRLSLLDFGMTGELDEAMRESLILLLDAIIKADARAVVEAYLELAPASESVNHTALLVDIKAVLYEIRRSNLADVSIGDAFDSLLRVGSRNGVHNPGEFFLLTRTFVILESLLRQLAPHYDYMESFREEIARLSLQHFSLERTKRKTTTLAHELERLISNAPGDSRRVLRRIAEGNLGRVQAPAVEALGERVIRNLERLSNTMVAAALIIGGALLVHAQMDGWLHSFGEIMVISGAFGILLASVGMLHNIRERP
ncbi:MAG: AarF/ABC1/UbiB kinase family protein, partial [Oscillochloris sp.]|nr:AarF/ABC1/UbiB kinase family protein [Oscillochloris sp.]